MGAHVITGLHPRPRRLLTFAAGTGAAPRESGFDRRRAHVGDGIVDGRARDRRLPADTDECIACLHPRGRDLEGRGADVSVVDRGRM